MNGHFVAGHFVAGEKRAANRNPADSNDNTLGEFASDGMAHLATALDAAQKAFHSWKKTPGPERGRVLIKAAQWARAHKEEIARDLTLEEGKTLGESRGEVEKGICVMEFCGGEAFRLGGAVVPSEMRSTLAYVTRAPLGVVSLITPWNFPWAIPAWKSAPALAAGNACILKPASLTPRTALWLAKAYQEGGLPDGLFNVLLGRGGELGEALVKAEQVRAVSFTGSTEIGRELAALASRSLKKVSAEMGGKNAVVVFDDADLDLAATGIIQGAFGSSGQRCTATSRVIATSRALPKLLERLEAQAKAQIVGPGIDAKSTMGPAVDEKQMETDLRYIGIAKEEGAKLVTGGKRMQEGALARGFFVEPTIFSGVKRDTRIAREEVFGPVLAVIEAASEEEAVSIANDTPFGLSASLYTSDVTRSMHFIDDIDVGIVHINSPTVGGEPQMPFGGTKGTGLGTREMGRSGVEFFTEEKAVYIDYTGQKRTVSFY